MSTQNQLRAIRSYLTQATYPMILVTLLIFFGFIIVIPIIFVGFGALWSAEPYERQGHFTLQYFKHIVKTPELAQVLINTVIMGTVSTFVSMAGGVGTALLVTRSKIRYKSYLNIMMFVPFIMPGYLIAIGWTFLFAPDIGIINTRINAYTGLSIEFYNIWWIGFIVGTHLMPIVYFLVAPGIEKINSELENAALVSGANYIKTLKSVTLSLSKPAIFSALIIIFIRGISAFTIPLVIGLRTQTWVVPTRIFTSARFYMPPDYGFSAALAVLLVGAALVLLGIESRFVGAVEQYQNIGGKGYRTDRVYDWGRWNRLIELFSLSVLFVTGIVPILILVYISLIPGFAGVFTWNLGFDNYIRAVNAAGFEVAVWNTFLLAVLGPIILMVAAFLSSYLLFKTDLWGKNLLDYIMLAPIGVPGVVYAIGIVWTYLFLIQDYIPLYGTLLGIFIALLGRFAPYATRSMHGGMASIDDSLEEAALVSGATPLRNLRAIQLPLLTKNFVFGYLLLVMFFVKNFTIVIFIYTTGSETISIKIWQYWTEALWGPTAAAATMLMMFVLFLSISVVKLTGSEISDIASQ